MRTLEQMPKSWQIQAGRATRAMTRYIRERGLAPTEELLADLSFDEAEARIGTPTNDDSVRYEQWLDWRTHVEHAVRRRLGVEETRRGEC